MKKNLRKILAPVLAFLLAAAMALPSAAAVPYRSYTYDSYGNAVELNDVYEPARTLVGQDFGLITMLEPADMVAAPDGNLYILDAGVGRVVVLDPEYRQTALIDAFTLDGEESPLSGATGLLVDRGGRIFIADTDNHRVICAGADGVITAVIGKPESDYFSDSVEFLPEKLVMDRAGNLYVKCRNIYQGAVLFDSAFRFEGFFGSEKVMTTADILADFFWKQFMTEEQKQASAQYVPTEITNFHMAADDFIYSISPARMAAYQTYKEEMDSVRRLNSKAADTLQPKMSKLAYGAMKLDARYLNFVDLVYDEKGYLNLLDANKGRIYHFDQNMQLIAAFSALGDYEGTFRQPVAIDMMGEDIVVLDKAKATLTVFRLTGVGASVHEALSLYNDGQYAQAVGPWRQVIERNPNFELAYIGIGSALYNQQEYKQAMEYFLLGRDSARYSEAFKEYRIEQMRANLAYIVIGAAALLAAALIARRLLRRRKEKRRAA